MQLKLEQRGTAVRIPVHVQPRAARDEMVGEHAGALKVRITASPVEGKANRELVRFLADVLGVPASAVRVVAGSAGRNKVIEVEGVTAAAVLEVVARLSKRR